MTNPWTLEDFVGIRVPHVGKTSACSFSGTKQIRQRIELAGLADGDAAFGFSSPAGFRPEVPHQVKL